MFQITTVTWIIIIFGIITCLPLLYAQLVMLSNPRGETAKELLIGKGEDWRDGSHFKSAYSFAYSDWLIFFPVFVLSLVGIFLHQSWGYLLLSISGAIQLYINVFLWFFEREYVYTSQGPLRYYTYYWGNFIYWGLAALLYGIFRISGKFI